MQHETFVLVANFVPESTIVYFNVVYAPKLEEN